MEIFFKCREDEGVITPLMIVEALINSDNITTLDLEELSRYLKVYVAFNDLKCEIICGREYKHV